MLITGKKLFEFYIIVINRELKTNWWRDFMKVINNFKMYKKCLIVVDMVNGLVREGVLHDNAIETVIQGLVQFFGSKVAHVHGCKETEVWMPLNNIAVI